MATSPARTLPSNLRLPKCAFRHSGKPRFSSRQWQSEGGTNTSLRLCRRCMTRMSCHDKASLDTRTASGYRSAMSLTEGRRISAFRLPRILRFHVSGLFTIGSTIEVGQPALPGVWLPIRTKVEMFHVWGHLRIHRIQPRFYCRFLVPVVEDFQW